VLHQKFCIFLHHFLHQFFTLIFYTIFYSNFLTPFFYNFLHHFLHQFFYTNFLHLFFTPFFYTSFFTLIFLHHFLTPIFLIFLQQYFLHQKFCLHFFYTNFLQQNFGTFWNIGVKNCLKKVDPQINWPVSRFNSFTNCFIHFPVSPTPNIVFRAFVMQKKMLLANPFGRAFNNSATEWRNASLSRASFGFNRITTALSVFRSYQILKCWIKFRLHPKTAGFFQKIVFFSFFLNKEKTNKKIIIIYLTNIAAG